MQLSARLLASARRLAAAAALTAAALFAVPAAALTPEDQADLGRVESYLNSINSLEARFLQVAPDGSLSEGRLYLRRPGRVRFEFDEPSPVLVVADGLWVVFHDKELKQTTRLPLSATPLSILLRDQIRFGGRVVVKDVDRGPGTLRVTVYDAEKPQEGQLTLVFSDQPLTLKQWVVTDAQGLTTNVALSQMETNVYLQPSLFVFYEDAPQSPPSR